MPAVSRSRPMTTRAGHRASKRRAMPRAGIMPTACNVSSNRTGCKVRPAGHAGMETQGKRFGVEENPLREVGNTVDYSFPVERKEFLFVTSPFGMRQDPADGKERMHTVSTSGATAIRSWHGKRRQVVAVKDKGHAPGNKSLTVEYTRPDGSKVQCTYMHLGEVSVKAGRYGTGRPEARPFR